LLCDIRNQKGVAIVAAIGVSLILMLVAIALSYKVGFFAKSTGIIKLKEQVDFVADLGLENFRFYLWDRKCYPPDWCAGVGDNGYADVTAQMKTAPNGQAYFKVQSISSGSGTIKHEMVDISGKTRGKIEFVDSSQVYYYGVFARRSRNEQVLTTMVSATKQPPTGAVKETEYTERTTLEAALFFDEKVLGYDAQKKQGKEKTGSIGETVTGL
jgi:hypothetical protein